MFSPSKAQVSLTTLLLFFIISCGQDKGVSPFGTSGSSGGSGNSGSGVQTVTATAANTCVSINVSSYLGCTVTRYRVTTTPASPPAFTTYVLPCSSCATCPYGTALSTSTNCGCATPGYIHFNSGERTTLTVFPSTTGGAGHVISANQLSLYMTDLTGTGTSGEIELEIECN